MNTLTAMSIARRLAQISPQAKMWVMDIAVRVFMDWIVSGQAACFTRKRLGLHWI